MLKILRIFFRLRKYFTHCKSMAYTENLGLRHYVGFSQTRSHMLYMSMYVDTLKLDIWSSI